MKYLKSYKLFESHYTIEEYIDIFCDELSRFNVSPVKVKELVKQLDFEDAIERNITPRQFVEELDKDMDFESGNFMGVRNPVAQQTFIKYL